MGLDLLGMRHTDEDAQTSFGDRSLAILKEAHTQRLCEFAVLRDLSPQYAMLASARFSKLLQRSISKNPRSIAKRSMATHAQYDARVQAMSLSSRVLPSISLF